MRLDEITRAVEAAGLAFRGAFHPEAEDLPEGVAAKTIVMLGVVGADQWAGFVASPEFRDGRAHPLDRWSLRVIGALARELGAEPRFPFESQPFMPFIHWAKKAEAVHESAMGMLIHPDFGLWHAWRGALLFEEAIVLPPKDKRASPCATCVDKPCLSACPVEAFKTGAFDVVACAGHLRAPQGGDCMGGGCLARRACPVGAKYRYLSDQAAFHMRAFRGDRA
ncbi:MAG TPA: hypothetical protein VNH64_06535 [Parvularculaceae bacterium]|nr:hypothetical protein [Parvularculaceae bacterium]